MVAINTAESDDQRNILIEKHAQRRTEYDLREMYTERSLELLNELHQYDRPQATSNTGKRGTELFKQLAEDLAQATRGHSSDAEVIQCDKCVGRALRNLIDHIVYYEHALDLQELSLDELRAL